ncbi:unnamed protein product [Blepharisma stoltei]|uniref:BAP29/BAP31 transmembrane domain-containing protein n=1 Tax=Blepharisma stoltei TaxID=1481888 RepID=A0AAU9JJW7_9CILI|nr:unnamed protein product [Blepharisma stoltei]
MSLNWLIGWIDLPVSIVILVIFLMPLVPLFVKSMTSRWLWNVQMRIGKNDFKVIHVLLVLFGTLFVVRAYNHINFTEELDSKEMLEADFKSKRHRIERDFYLAGLSFACWVYIWRLCPLIDEYSKLSKEKKAK